MASKLGALAADLGASLIDKMASDYYPTDPHKADLLRQEGPAFVAQVVEVLDQLDDDKRRKFRTARISDMATQLAASGALGLADGTLAKRSVQLAGAILDEAERYTAPQLEAVS